VIHYHGTPITPGDVLGKLAGRCFCVSYAAPAQVKVCHEIGQSVMLDNGAYSVWQFSQAGRLPPLLLSASKGDWSVYYDWCEPWLEYATTWAVIPDVIDGDEEANDRLLVNWFKRGLPKGAPVWHMHESIDRLKRLAHGYERVCIGSSGQYACVGHPDWHRRMQQAFNAIAPDRAPGAWIHMLRGMSLSGSEYPFASVDSTDVARNHNRPQNDALEMALRWDGMQNPARWVYREQLELVA
jgi:hypothetical protein